MTFRASKALATERHFPYIVEIELPSNGLDVHMNREIAVFLRKLDIRLPSDGHDWKIMANMDAGVSPIHQIAELKQSTRGHPLIIRSS